MNAISLCTVTTISLCALAGAVPEDKLPDPPAGQAWELVWHDEFEGAKIDDAKWECPDTAPGRLGTSAPACWTAGAGLVMRCFEENGKYIDGLASRTRGSSSTRTAITLPGPTAEAGGGTESRAFG